jgi:hypothetical protein
MNYPEQTLRSSGNNAARELHVRPSGMVHVANIDALLAEYVGEGGDVACMREHIGPRR